MNLPKINLVEKPRQRFAMDFFTIGLMLAIITASMLFFAYGRQLDYRVQNTQNEIATRVQAIQDLTARLPDVTRIEHENASLSHQIASVKELKSDPIRYANLLWELGEVMPENCFITSLQIDPSTRTASLSGVSTSAGGVRALDALSRLMTNFHESRYFLDATLSQTSLTPTGWAFTITSRYDEQAALRSPAEVPAKVRR